LPDLAVVNLRDEVFDTTYINRPLCASRDEQLARRVGHGVGDRRAEQVGDAVLDRVQADLEHSREPLRLSPILWQIAQLTEKKLTKSFRLIYPVRSVSNSAQSFLNAPARSVSSALTRHVRISSRLSDAPPGIWYTYAKDSTTTPVNMFKKMYLWRQLIRQAVGAAHMLRMFQLR